MDVARSLLSSAVLGPLLIGALALAWFLAVRLRGVSVDTGGVPTLDLRRSSEPSADQGEVKSDTRSDTP